MNWDGQEQSRIDDDVETQWVPSPHLSRKLWIGTLATVLAGGLFVTSLALDVVEGPQLGFSASDALAWAALLPAIWVVISYMSLGREVGSPSIGRSAQCLFLSTLALRVFDLAADRLFIPPVQAVLWIVLICGVVGVIIWTFISDSDAKPTVAAVPEKKKSPDDTSAGGATRIGALGAIVVAIFAVFKFFGKALVKVALFKWIINFFEKLHLRPAFVGEAFIALLSSCYVIWFAITKLRAQARLGGWARILGWTEIIRVVLLLALSTMILVQLAECARQPGLKEAEVQREVLELQHRLWREYAAVELGLDAVWTALTVCLFLSLRGRRDLEAEHLTDFERASVY